MNRRCRKGINPDDLPPFYREQITAQVARINITGTDPDAKQPARDKPVAAKKGPRFNSPVYISFLCFRQHLADRDGISGKAAIDGLVNCAILKNDTTAEIKKIDYKQHLIAQDQKEMTIIIIDATDCPCYESGEAV